jgi:cytoskeletal protein RodZ
MALSMDEQRMLAEIERRLSAEDPRLAAKLSSFKRSGPPTKLRSPRNRIIGTLFTVVLLAVISMMVYSMVPFRAHMPRSGSSPQASTPGVTTSARHNPPRSGVKTVARASQNTSASPNSAVTRTAAAKVAGSAATHPVTG